MRYLKAFLFVVLCNEQAVAETHCAFADGEPISVRYGIYQVDYLPYQEVSGPRLRGFDIDLVRTIFSRIPAYSLEPVVLPTARVPVALKSGEIDIAGLFVTAKERHHVYLVKTPLHRSEYTLASLAGASTHIRDIRDLQGKRVGIVLGNLVGDRLPALATSGHLTLIKTKTVDSMMRMLQAGRIDAAFANREMLMVYGEAMDVPLRFNPLSLVPARDYALAVQEHATRFEPRQLVSCIEHIMADLDKEGVIDTLRRQYFLAAASPNSN